MEEIKEHQIRTIEDILKVVTLENKENFLKDFSNWIDFNLMMKEKILKEAPNSGIEFPKLMNWIDDNKNNISINIKLNQEIEEKNDHYHGR